MAEIDHEEWKELRARVDSLANAVFFIAGGALTLSVSVLLGLNQKIGQDLQFCVRLSWLLLLGAIVGFVILKVNLIFQAFLRGTLKTEVFNRIVGVTNLVGWVIGLCSLAMFIAGMYAMVDVALAVIFTKGS